RRAQRGRQLEPREVGEAHRHERRPRGERNERRVGEGALRREVSRGAEKAAASLTDAGAEAGVALERFDVGMAAGERVVQVVERHVLAGADEGAFTMRRHAGQGRASRATALAACYVE